MSGKMKKLICALLTGTMVLGSVGLVGFAADDTKAASTDASTAVEATAAPEAAAATEAPAASQEKAETATPTPAASTEQAAPESTVYDSDAYYQKALALCQGLGIITGYEDGSVKPDSTVTRAEMAAIILRMLANNSTSTYQNIFTDVAASHWAASTIQTASALGIINGMGDGTFVPDGNVQYEQVAKMIVCAMNYKDTADYYGGYPNGYLKIASDLDITKNAPGNIGVASERGVVIKMVYNALLADYNEPDGMEYGAQKYKAERTLAEYAFDVKEEKGILLGTATTTLTGKDLLKGQVAIKSKSEGEDTEEIRTYNTELAGLDDLLASNVTFYYEVQNNGDDRHLLAIAENTAKTTSVTLSNEDIRNIETFEGFDGTKGEIKVYDKSKYKLSAAIEVVYNGTLITEADFADAKAKAKEDDPRFAGKEYIDFLKPDVGTIRLVENNDENEGYDIAFVDSYETLLVSSATAKKVIANINNVSTSIDVDETANDLTISTTISGMEAAPRNLKKNDVASLKRSLDGETLEFVVSGENVTGTIKSKSTDDGKEYITVDGKEYEVDANAVKDAKMGVEAIFHMDNFNRVGYIETVTASGMLQSGENYGWIISVYDSDDGEDKVVTLFTQEGKSVNATIGSSLEYWAPDATEPVSLKEKDAKAAVEALMEEDQFIKFSDTDGNAIITKPDKNTKLNTPIRLVKYKLNSSNKLSKLYCAVDSSTTDDESALRIDKKNKNGILNVSGSVAGYVIADGIIEFNVPKLVTDMKQASNFSIKEVASSNYVVRENGSSRDYVIGEFDGLNANIVINFTASANAEADPTEMGTAEGGPSIMVIDSIAEGYDSDNDVDIYEISGYVGGSPVSVTTNKNTNVGAGQKTLISTSGNRPFNFTQLWSAPGSDDALTDYLHKGDIILYTADGRVILRFASLTGEGVVDADGNFDPTKMITYQGNGWYGGARVTYRFGELLEHGLEDMAYVVVNADAEYTLTFDPSVAIQLVTINSTGKVTVEKEAITVSELEDGDCVLANLADKNTNMKAMVVYRFDG